MASHRVLPVDPLPSSWLRVFLGLPLRQERFVHFSKGSLMCDSMRIGACAPGCEPDALQYLTVDRRETVIWAQMPRLGRRTIGGLGGLQERTRPTLTSSS